MPRRERRPGTTRKQAQAPARLPDERYRSLVDAAPDMIFTLDADGSVTSLNPAFETLTGWPRAEWIGESLSSLLHPEDAPLAKDCLRRVLKGDVQALFEVRLRSKSGAYLTGEFMAVPHRQDGEVTGVDGIARDVTTRKQGEQKARQADRLAALGVLLGGVAHELNNPLFIISGYAQLAREKLAQRLYEDLPADLETIREAGQRASAIVNRFLGVANRADVPLEPCRVDVLVMQALDLLSAQFALDQIAVRTHLDADLPQLTANAQNLTHVFMNLFANAREAMAQAHGRGTLSVSVTRVPARTESWVEVRVTDDGPGIAAAHLPHIFDLFYTTKPLGVSTGLGLSICHRIVTELGGELVCDSVPGQGATFIVRLPAPIQSATGSGS
ncbi:MAG: PAS domain S-box protein [Nitrospirae bacterium]|nr:MAG: PAS domain S-box protein [Nitrospirota bacterium]